MHTQISKYKPLFKNFIDITVKSLGMTWQNCRHNLKYFFQICYVLELLHEVFIAHQRYFLENLKHESSMILFTIVSHQENKHISKIFLLGDFRCHFWAVFITQGFPQKLCLGCSVELPKPWNHPHMDMKPIFSAQSRFVKMFPWQFEVLDSHFSNCLQAKSLRTHPHLIFTHAF